MPRSEKKKGFFGDEYTETRDDSGQKISESREKTGFFGDKYTETTDPSGRKVSESREKTGFFGDKYVETTDPSGRKISESRRRTGFFGDKYTETTEAPRPRKPSTDWAALFDGDFSVLFGLAFKLFFWLAAIVFVIWLVMMALAITVMLTPIWLGAVTVGVITGFLLANSTADKLSEENLARVPVVEEQKGKKTRFRVSEDFLKAAIKFNPHVLSLIAATAAYCIALAGWPLFTTSDTFTQILLGAGSVAGTILGTLAGRRVLLWQYENRIFERAESDDPTRLIAPKVALGFSIPGLIALAGVGIFALVQSPGQVDFAKSFGFKSEAQTAQAPTQSNSAGSPGILANPTARATSSESKPVPISPNGTAPLLLAESSNGVFRCLKVQEDEGDAIVVEMVGEQPVTLLRGIPGGRSAIFSESGNDLIVDVGTGSLGSVLRSFRRNSQGEWQEAPNSIIEEIVAQFRHQVAGGSDRHPNHRYVNMESLSSKHLTGSISGDWTGPSGTSQFSIPFQISNPDGSSSDEASAASTTEESARQFVVSRLNTEASHDLDRILTNYADRVNYWDNGVVDRDFIRKDKSAYFERWPVTREEIEGPINVTRSGDDWIAKFRTRFRVENPAKGVVIQGLQEATYTLQLSDRAGTEYADLYAISVCSDFAMLPWYGRITDYPIPRYLQGIVSDQVGAEEGHIDHSERWKPLARKSLKWTLS